MYITVCDAAKMLDIDRAKVYRLIESNTLVSRRDPGGIKVSMASLQRHMAENYRYRNPVERFIAVMGTLAEQADVIGDPFTINLCGPSGPDNHNCPRMCNLLSNEPMRDMVQYDTETWKRLTCVDIFHESEINMIHGIAQDIIKFPRVERPEFRLRIASNKFVWVRSEGRIVEMWGQHIVIARLVQI